MGVYDSRTLSHPALFPGGARPGRRRPGTDGRWRAAGPV